MRPARHSILSVTASWVALALVAAFAAYLDHRPPRRQFILRQDLHFFSYPLLPETIPAWAVLIYACIGSWLICMCLTVWQVAQQSPHTPVAQILRTSAWDLHDVTLSLTYSVMATTAVTALTKSYIGRPRPSFAARCWPDRKIVFENAVDYPLAYYQMDGGYPLCHGKPDLVKDGMKSWMSGHASVSMAGLAFLSLHIAHVLPPPSDARFDAWRLTAVAAPLMVSLFTALSRVHDYWHHWQDVTLGLVTGFVIAYLTHRRYTHCHRHAATVKLKRDEEQLLPTYHMPHRSDTPLSQIDMSFMPSSPAPKQPQQQPPQSPQQQQPSSKFGASSSAPPPAADPSPDSAPLGAAPPALPTSARWLGEGKGGDHWGSAGSRSRRVAVEAYTAGGSSP